MRPRNLPYIAAFLLADTWSGEHADPFICYVNETTTTTLDDFTNASLVQPMVIDALTERPGLMNFAREINLIGQPTPVASIPTETSWWGSANDDGAGVATAYNATQGTALANTAMASGAVTCTPTEYGVATALTDNVGEDSIPIDHVDRIMLKMLFVLALAMEDDYLAQFASLSNSVGSTGVDLTLAQTLSAPVGIRTRGAVCDHVCFVLDTQQANDLESAIQAASTSMAVFAMSADRLIGYQPTPDHGLGASRRFASVRGFPAFVTGLTDTANAGADVVGACIVPSTDFNDKNSSTTHGMAWKRLPRFEVQRQAKNRATDMVTTARAGFTELQDGAGTAIISDA